MMTATGGMESTTGRALMPSLHQPSPRTGAAAAPVSLTGRGLVLSQRSARLSDDSLRLSSSLLTCTNRSEVARLQLLQSTEASLRHSHSEGHHVRSIGTPRKVIGNTADALAKAQSRIARKLNDSMVYIDGPQIYTCAQCRTHLTSHDEIISKSFHGRHGRAYLFDNCVNVSVGPAEDRRLITGLHSVCDIFCKRCKTMVGWTYARAYEHSQKYKEGKFIIEKINLHLEESDYYDVEPPAGERKDRFRARSISWGSDSCASSQRHDTIYEYNPCGSLMDSHPSPRKRQSSLGSVGYGDDQNIR